MYNSIIIGTGYYVPENIVTNDDLSKLMDTSDEWIRERTGIEQRRFATRGKDTTTSMGVRAAERAIEKAKINKEDIDFLIFATLSPDYYFPGCGVLAQKELGLGTIGALDIRNQCSGFVYALSVADQFISEGAHAEELAIVTPGVGKKWVTDLIKENDPEDTSYYPYMNGQFVFKNAVVRFSEVIMEGLKANNLTEGDIDLFIPHQANLRISQFIQQKFKLSDAQVFNNIQKYGNTTAASIGIALAEAVEQGRVKENDLRVLAAFGSGFTWGSVVIKM